ncbi:MAG: methyltransferase domain-containing protein [Actinomycetota bacterium]|nr:methyltransferase domain-containing protein [Actinomycetota bacterium]
MTTLAADRLAVAWHDAECGSYRADLPLWRELAEEVDGPLLDLGCGSGRVALELAARGHEVTGVDSEAALVSALRSRATGLPVRAETADARSLALGRRFVLALAPMQVVQLMGGRAGRARLLDAAHRHLEPGGRLAVALADPFEKLTPEQALLPLPDVREKEGWVLSSRPVAVRAEEDGVAIDRVRQAVSPDGELTEELVTILLDNLTPTELAAEAADRGFEALPPRRVEATADHTGSAVVMLRRL